MSEHESTIDGALKSFVALPTAQLRALRRRKDLTVAESAAIAIIDEALDEGGDAMKILVERTGGKAVGRNININQNSESGPTVAQQLAEILGGSRQDALEAAVEAQEIEADGDAED